MLFKNQKIKKILKHYEKVWAEFHRVSDSSAQTLLRLDLVDLATAFDLLVDENKYYGLVPAFSSLKGVRNDKFQKKTLNLMDMPTNYLNHKDSYEATPKKGFGLKMASARLKMLEEIVKGWDLDYRWELYGSPPIPKIISNDKLYYLYVEYVLAQNIFKWKQEFTVFNTSASLTKVYRPREKFR